MKILLNKEADLVCGGDCLGYDHLEELQTTLKGKFNLEACMSQICEFHHLHSYNLGCRMEKLLCPGKQWPEAPGVETQTDISWLGKNFISAEKK